MAVFSRLIAELLTPRSPCTQAHLYRVRPDRYDPGGGRVLQLHRHHGGERVPALAPVRPQEVLGLQGHQRSQGLIWPGVGTCLGCQDFVGL